MKIKELFKEYETAENRANAADEAWENDYENEELEKEFTEAYEAEHKAFEALAEEITSLTAGAIDTKTAGYMIRANRDNLKKLIERIA